MSDSGLKLPSTTELEGRVREALKVAREFQAAIVRQRSREQFETASANGDDGLDLIIRILEDGRS